MNEFAYVANVPIVVEGREVAAGETFVASSGKYGWLLSTGKARLASAPAPRPKAIRRTTRGRYQRRDLRAEP